MQGNLDINLTSYSSYSQLPFRGAVFLVDVTLSSCGECFWVFYRQKHSEVSDSRFQQNASSNHNGQWAAAPPESKPCLNGAQSSERRYRVPISAGGFFVT